MKDEREENEYLRLLIQDNRLKSINLFDEQSKVYTKETQECVYELLLTECESNKRWTLILFTVDTDGTLLGVISTSFKTLTRLVVTLLFSNSYTHSCVSLVYTLK
jgi:hypothetical protein